jgi:peptide/nickel transport system permease protein
MAGTYISLTVGFISVAISLIVGVTIGLLAGYYRGWVDATLSWIINVIWSIPNLLVVMAFILAFGTGFWKVFIAIGLTMWVEVARIVRGQILSIREKEYIEAARSIGMSDSRIMFREMLPQLWPILIVISAANFSSAILIESGMSFLGLGVQIPAPSWGNMIRENYAMIPTQHAHLALAPGICIMLTVLALSYVGNGLRSALDIKKI